MVRGGVRDPYAYEGNGYEAPAPAYGGAGGGAYDRAAYDRAAPPAYGAPAGGYDRAGYAPDRCRGAACVGFRALLVQGSGATACVALLCGVCHCQPLTRHYIVPSQ